MKVVSTSHAPAAIGPYSQAIDLGNMVFVSGQIPVDPATGKMADTVEEQAAQSLANLKAILAEAGLSMANVVKTVIFLADINDFAAVNAEVAVGIVVFLDSHGSCSPFLFCVYSVADSKHFIFSLPESGKAKF